MPHRSRSTSGSRRNALALALALGVLALAGCASSGDAARPADTAQADAAEHGRLEPRYQPREPEPEPWYNSDYLFGMTRGVTDSTMHPAAKVPLLVLTIPLDLVLLPFAAIGGFFG